MEENISNALLMAGAMLVFIIAVSLTFSLISQTKTTADTVLFSYDDTKYYDQGLEDITYTLANEKDLNRIVDMETILPTVYRYIKEHYGVTIMKSNGEIIARFDETTESMVHQWKNYLRDALKDGENSKCEIHYNYLKNLYESAGLTFECSSYDDLENLWEKIYHSNKKSGNIQITYGTPWLGDESKVAKRLDADFGGGIADYASGDHEGLNLLNEYEGKKFKEIYVFVTADDGKILDEESGDSVNTKSSETKLEIIYVMED